MTRFQRWLPACGIALLVLAACSRGGDSDEAAPTTSAPAATQPTTTMPSVDTSFTGQHSAEFCELARTYSERSTSLSPTATPAQLRTVAREGQTAISRAVNAAPAEIKRDVEVIANTVGAFLGELERVNYEVARVPPSAFQSLQSPEFHQSTTRFQAYARTVCRIG